MLDTLPLELLNMMLSNITSHRDLKQVCEVCTRLRDCAIPYLYRSVVLSAPEMSLKKLATVVRSIPRRYVKHIRELELKIPIHQAICSRCVHHDNHSVDEDESVVAVVGDEDTNGEACPFVNLMQALNNLQFLDDQLRTFRWNLGMCLPNKLLNGDELSFLRKQKKIESLTLVTDAYCVDSVGSVRLAQFPDLRSLSWKGLSRYSDLECLKDYMRVYGHQIVSLTLDLVKLEHVEVIWIDALQSHEMIPHNLLFQTVLDARPKSEQFFFQSLEYVDLSAVPFADFHVEIPLLHRMAKLKTLKLRNCLGDIGWLEDLSSSGNRMKLKCFQLVLFGSGPGPTATTEAISKFIKRAPELETLCLMLTEPINWRSIMSAASSCSRLTHFVVHSLADEDDEDNAYENVTWPSVSVLPSPSIVQSCSGTEFNAEIDPPYQHEDLCNLAKWAFSADGLPKLDVLAWGDFSYEGRYSKYNVLFCRSETGYRRLSPSDVWLWDLVNDNMDMLAACPFDDITEP
ncbi:hypothetical protein AbraIFM66951_011901 [Aspergillus brasiliensis]|nr:hypothetical protein AbraIFM66951_011901 [Aspergillus brasiliensis]